MCASFEGCRTPNPAQCPPGWGGPCPQGGLAQLSLSPCRWDDQRQPPAPWAANAAERRQELAPLPSSLPASTNQTLATPAFFPLPNHCHPAPTPTSLPLLRSRPCPQPLAEVAKGGPCPRGVGSSPGPSLHRAAPRRTLGSRGSLGSSDPWVLLGDIPRCHRGSLPARVSAAALLSPAPIPGRRRKETVKYFCWQLGAGAARPPAPVATANSPQPGCRSANPASPSTRRLRRAPLPPPTPALPGRGAGAAPTGGPQGCGLGGGKIKMRSIETH